MKKIKVSFYLEDDEYVEDKVTYKATREYNEDDKDVDMLVELCQCFMRSLSYSDEQAYCIQNINWNRYSYKKPDERWTGCYLLTLKDGDVISDYWLGNKFKNINDEDILAWTDLPFGYGEH